MRNKTTNSFEVEVIGYASGLSAVSVTLTNARGSSQTLTANF